VYRYNSAKKPRDENNFTNEVNYQLLKVVIPRRNKYIYMHVYSPVLLCEEAEINKE